VSDPDRGNGRRPGSRMAAEIAQQPDVLAGQLDNGLAGIRKIARHIRAAAPRFVVLAARGTSDHAALYAKYLVEIGLGLPAGLASPSTLTAYGARPTMDGVLWIAVSQSGGSPDLVDSTTAAAEAGATTVAVTNSADSPLAGAAQLHVDVLAGAERAVAATKTYTAQLLALWLLIDAWQGGDASAARALPGQAGQVLDLPEIDEVSSRYRFVDKVVVTARGYAYPTAREAALKLMETSYLSAHAFSGADLLHGPLAMIDQDRPVVAVVPEGVGGQAMRPVLERLRDRGADLCVLGGREASELAGASSVIELPQGIREDLAPIVQIMPLQQLAHAMAVGRGFDPDAPRGLHKVTETW
jgi:glutamine---fructose-6-phosphate transaminase (isomerizing)